MKKALNVLGCIAAVIFSIALVVTVVLFSLYNGVASFTQPETIANTVTEMVKTIDFEEFLPSAEDVQDILPIDGVTVDTIEELITTDAASQAIGLYAEDVLAAVLTGETDERQFTPEALKSLANEQIDEIVDAVKPYLPEEVEEDVIVSEIQTLVDTHAETIVEALPVPTIPEDTPDNPAIVIRQILDPAVMTTLIILIVALVILVYACRFPRFGGMLWLGIDAAVVSLLTAALAILIGGTVITDFITDLLPSMAALIDPVVSVFVRDLTVTAIVCAVLGVAFIVAYILLRRKFVTGVATPADAPLAEVAAAE